MAPGISCEKKFIILPREEATKVKEGEYKCTEDIETSSKSKHRYISK